MRACLSGAESATIDLEHEAESPVDHPTQARFERPRLRGPPILGLVGLLACDARTSLEVALPTEADAGAGLLFIDFAGGSVSAFSIPPRDGLPEVEGVTESDRVPIEVIFVAETLEELELASGRLELPGARSRPVSSLEALSAHRAVFEGQTLAPFEPIRELDGRFSTQPLPIPRSLCPVLELDTIALDTQAVIEGLEAFEPGVVAVAGDGSLFSYDGVSVRSISGLMGPVLAAARSGDDLLVGGYGGRVSKVLIDWELRRARAVETTTTSARQSLSWVASTRKGVFAMGHPRGMGAFEEDVIVERRVGESWAEVARFPAVGAGSLAEYGAILELADGRVAIVHGVSGQVAYVTEESTTYELVDSAGLTTIAQAPELGILVGTLDGRVFRRESSDWALIGKVADNYISTIIPMGSGFLVGSCCGYMGFVSTRAECPAAPAGSGSMRFAAPLRDEWLISGDPQEGSRAALNVVRRVP